MTVAAFGGAHGHNTETADAPSVDVAVAARGATGDAAVAVAVAGAAGAAAGGQVGAPSAPIATTAARDAGSGAVDGLGGSEGDGRPYFDLLVPQELHPGMLSATVSNCSTPPPPHPTHFSTPFSLLCNASALYCIGLFNTPIPLLCNAFVLYCIGHFTSPFRYYSMRLSCTVLVGWLADG